MSSQIEAQLLDHVLKRASRERDCIDVAEFAAQHSYTRAEVAEALDSLDSVRRGAVSERAWFEDRAAAEAEMADYEDEQ